MNRLGEKGTRTSESKKKQRASELSRDKELADLEAEITKVKEENERLGGSSAPTKKSASKKRAKKENSDDEEEEEKMPAKKKRATKAKKEEVEDEDVKPARKSRAKKVVKHEDQDIMPPLVDFEGEPRVDRVKAEEDEEKDAKPVKKSRAKKVVKKEEEEEEINESPSKVENTKDWSTSTVKDLKSELDKRGLSKSGKKSELVARLEADDQSSEHEETALNPNIDSVGKFSLAQSTE